MSYHTIIVGLGAMGSATAYHLARRGHKVLGLERYAPAHDQGSSHGQSRIIRLAYFEDPAYVPLLQRAYELWHELNATASERVLSITGGMMISEGGSDLVERCTRSAIEYNLPHEILDGKEIKRRFPQFNAPNDAVGLYETVGGIVYPEAAIRMHQAGALAAGATLRFEEPMLSWQASAGGDRVQVTTAQGTYEAERLIFAVGAWAPEILRDTGLPLTVKRNILYWFEPNGQTEYFQLDNCPIYIWEASERPSIYGFPILPGTPHGVKIAFHNFGPLCTPETVDRTVTEQDVERIRTWLANRIPAVSQGRLVATATCFYTLTPDEDFLIDTHPNHQQVLICSPCSGHGYKFASAMGEIMADLAEHGTTRHPIEIFGAKRFA
jgi:sarcosine oxidase